MRHIFAVAILGASLALTASAALASSRNTDPAIPQRTWDGMQVQPTQITLAQPGQMILAGGALSVIAGPGTDDSFNPYRPNPAGNGFQGK